MTFNLKNFSLQKEIRRRVRIEDNYSWAKRRNEKIPPLEYPKNEFTRPTAIRAFISSITP